MQLVVPGVGTEQGPTWAEDLNNSLGIIDLHDHSPGNGVKINPAGLDINADLSIQNNNIIDQRASTFLAQSALITDLNSIYDVNGDFYVNDGFGNQIRLTQSGSIAGASGSITGLVSPASATYVPFSQTFVWQADANKPATMDQGSIIIRKLVANSDGIKIAAPSSLLNTSSLAYTLTLPGAVPSVQSFATIDNTGAIAAPWTVDNSTIKIVSNQLVAQASAIIPANSDIREHAYELNGDYPQLTFPLTDIDSEFLVPFNITITSIWITNGTAGTSGTTEFDLQVAATAGGSLTSIFSTTGKIDSTAISGVYTDSGTVVAPATGVTKPVLSTTAILAGSVIQWNLVTSMTAPAADARIRIFYRQT